jgi:hypothetical protein
MHKLTIVTLNIIIEHIQYKKIFFHFKWISNKTSVYIILYVYILSSCVESKKHTKYKNKKYRKSESNFFHLKKKSSQNFH